MKAEIKNGLLSIIPENKTEEIKVRQWIDERTTNICTGEITTTSIRYETYEAKENKVQR